ncbi:MAG: biotin--[acetyl-CoA-carboxylase] ligase [Gammaproteobacteria bacterium]|nr:biotin--[acetyl-CoA-carboxylase] ligase [Gammaproteobacteria bacterium]
MPIMQKLINLVILDSTDSTNEWIKRHHNQNCEYQACLAAQQTSGKGQPGKNWYSPKGENIYLSLLINNTIPAPQLSLLSALAVASSCLEIDKKLPIKIKWPNDIMCDGKKIAGVLLEQFNKNSLIIGIGLNLHLSKQDKQQISQPVTALNELTSKKLNRTEIANLLLKNLIHTIKTYQKIGFAPFLSQWKQLDFLNNKEIAIFHANKTYNGTYLGINENGQVQLKTSSTIMTLSSGTIVDTHLFTL